MTEPTASLGRTEQQRERQREHAANYRLFNADKVQMQAARWRRDNQRNIKHHHLLSRYGIGIDEYDALYEKVGGKCQICAAPIAHIVGNAKPGDKACLDHCHDSGKVRGLLCHYCNRSLAFFEKYKEQATTYLEGADMAEEKKPEPHVQPSEWQQLDLFSDEPLVCSRDQTGDKPCDSCQ